MKTETIHLEEHTITLRNPRTGQLEHHTVPEDDITYAPVLANVHDDLFGDVGEFYLSWQDGWLCPFDSQVGRKNMRCVAGRRKHCPGNGLEITQKQADLSPEWYGDKVGKVICYEWCHRLSTAYWDIPLKDLLELPDNENKVKQYILSRVREASKWKVWRKELTRRKRTKKQDWLKPLSTRK